MKTMNTVAVVWCDGTAACECPDCEARTRVSLTFGELPSYDSFATHFEAACPTGSFAVRNCKRVGSADFNADELYAELGYAMSRCWNDEDEVAGEWASCVLSVLGFEWV